jgi:hypothetical protein
VETESEYFEVDKMHAAHRQLNVAIRLHFQDDDPVAVLTLAGAAARIFSDLAEHRHGERSWDAQAQQATGLAAKEYFGIIRQGQNFLKHADDDPEGSFRWKIEDTEGLIMGACMNAGLLDDLSPAAYVFKRWYIARYRSRFPDEWEPGREATEFFPGIDRLSDREQRAWGAARVDEVSERAV